MIDFGAPPAYEEFVIGKELEAPTITGTEEFVVGDPKVQTPIDTGMEEFVTVNKPTFCPDGTCHFGSSTPSATEEFINVNPPIGPNAMEHFLFVDEETGLPPG